MPKFNKKASIGQEVASHPDRVENYEGGIAFKTDPKTELTLRFLTYLVGEPKFYTPDAREEMNTIRGLIQTVAISDPEYLMKLASYARNEMYLRSAPIFMLVEAAQYDAVKPFIKAYTPTILRRADELTEVIAYFIARNGEIGSGGKASLPNALKKGIAHSFYNFDAYQFAKYDRDGTVKLKDTLKLVHPKPRNEAEALLFKQIRDRTLPIPETWETVISVNGSTKENWESVMPKMGYMAKLRNLRNFLKVGVDIEPVVQHLTNPGAVKNSKQFPFRFLSAYKSLEGTDIKGDPFTRNKLQGAVLTALDLSVENLPRLPGRTFVTSDNSGSMESPLTKRSSVEYIDIANIMGALAHRISDQAIASVFAEGFEVVGMHPGYGVMMNTSLMREAGERVGYATNAFLALHYLLQNDIKVDRILLFSDMQCYSTYTRGWQSFNFRGDSLVEQFEAYKRQVNPRVKLYSFDLTGYGTVQFPQSDPNVVLLAGWSDRVLEFISKYEKFGTDMIQGIESYNPF